MCRLLIMNHIHFPLPISQQLERFPCLHFTTLNIYSVYHKKLYPLKLKLSASSDCFELMIYKNKRSGTHWNLIMS